MRGEKLTRDAELALYQVAPAIRRKKPAKRPAYRPKRTQAERRETTQTRVLNAAIKVLLEKGYANFTTAEVAKKAGVSRGAQMNYYRTRNDLILAARRYYLAKTTAEAASFAEKSLATHNTLEAFLENVNNFFLGESYTASIEFTVAARTDAYLARGIGSLLAEYRHTRDHIWIDTFCRAGYDRKAAQDFVLLTNHVYRGMALSAIWASAENKEEDRKLRGLWTRMAKSLIKNKKRR